jgi:hypothetical protein
MYVCTHHVNVAQKAQCIAEIIMIVSFKMNIIIAITILKCDVPLRLHILKKCKFYYHFHY